MKCFSSPIVRLLLLSKLSILMVSSVICSAMAICDWIGVQGMVLSARDLVGYGVVGVSFVSLFLLIIVVKHKRKEARIDVLQFFNRIDV